MMNDKATHPIPPAKQPRAEKHVENSTDATRGEPLAMRANKRKAELELALSKLSDEDKRGRSDIEVAVSSISALLTGDTDHLSDTTAAELSRVLESSKHLAETNPVSKSRERK